MEAHGQAEALGIYALHRCVERSGFPCRNVDERAKPFILQLVEVIQPDNRWRNEQALGRNGHAVEDAVFHALAIGHQLVIGCLVNDGANVGRRIGRISNIQAIHRTAQHFERMIRNIFLQQQQAKGGAALSCGLETRDDDITHDLFRQSGGIDDHRIQTARFRNERHQRASIVEQEVAGDGLGGRDRSCEHHTANAGVRRQLRADIACAGHQLQRVCRDAGLMRERNGKGGDGGRLRGGLCNHRIAGHQSGGDLS